MEQKISRIQFLLTNMGLNDYQSQALSTLLFLGESKASTISKTSGVPDARIYGVLEELAQKGLIITKPGRPTLYSPMSPEEIAQGLVNDSMIEAQKRLDAIKLYESELIDYAKEVFLKGGETTPRIPLLRVVSVGEVSLSETAKLYRSAKSEVMIMTRAMEYFPKVSEKLSEASKQGVKIRIIMRSKNSLSPEDVKKRDEIIKQIQTNLVDCEIHQSPEVLIRGCIIDPETSPKALFLVEEKGVPYVLREAAITGHPGVVKGLASMFNLKWRHDSEPLD